MATNGAEVLLAKSSQLSARMTALFELRSDLTNLDLIHSALDSEVCESVLFRHEVAFVIGQIGSRKSIPLLSKVLEDVSDDPIVRHESAEALVAIISKNFIEVDADFNAVFLLLLKYEATQVVEVAETCKIAKRQLETLRSSKSVHFDESFNTTDPTPALNTEEKQSTEQLGTDLGNSDLELFQRYRILFTLRNNKDSVSTEKISNVLNSDTSSALFRHEVAYVLGQINSDNHTPTSVQDLLTNLANTSEHEMVRHESAEALGSIAENEVLEKQCAILENLSKFCSDEKTIVKESCELALAAASYWEKFGSKEEERS